MTVTISCDHPANASGGYSWPEAGATVDVDDATAAVLIRLPGFARAEPAVKTDPKRPALRRTAITEA